MLLKLTQYLTLLNDSTSKFKVDLSLESLQQASCEILQELMQQMASVEYTENVTDDQLEAMAGGEAIRYQAAAFGVTRNNKVLKDCTCPRFSTSGN